jgi:hypothetical protein
MFFTPSSNPLLLALWVEAGGVLLDILLIVSIET